MLPGSVRPASFPCRLERQAKPTPVLWRAAAARRGAARCGPRRRDRSFSCCINQLDSAELVIKMQRRRLDSDVGNGGWMRREASAERFEIGQSFGIELGLDCPPELGFPGTIMSERQQSAGRAGTPPLAVPGPPSFQG